ncbi:MAG: P1 family peptidase [Candidatus Eremiobacteraeota bacterium]|nr:P1 family peptidase [Candidatus Eremiobacteraeota bacterium]
MTPPRMLAADDKPAAFHAGPFPSGPVDGITDVAGVRVAHVTKIAGTGVLHPGVGPVRTGATAILQNRDPWTQRCAAAFYALNGNGEMTGTHWIEEAGFIEHPILLTATTNVPRVADGVIDWMIRVHPEIGVRSDVPLPVVAECNDEALNDAQGRHVHADEIPALLDAAAAGQFNRGNVGAGTGMHGFGFKGGIGSASRKLSATLGGYTVGVLLNLNDGLRAQLLMAGVRVGQAFAHDLLPVFPRRAAFAEHGRAAGGSIIVIVATDAPLEARVLGALAKRATLGLARTGWTSTVSSGDLFLAISTSNVVSRDLAKRSVVLEADEDRLDALYSATADSTESAVYDALWHASTMVGRDGITFYGLPHARVRELLASR